MENQRIDIAIVSMPDHSNLKNKALEASVVALITIAGSLLAGYFGARAAEKAKKHVVVETKATEEEK